MLYDCAVGKMQLGSYSSSRRDRHNANTGLEKKDLKKT